MARSLKTVEYPCIHEPEFVDCVLSELIELNFFRENI